MIETISILSVGFSLFSAVILFIAYVFFLKNVNKSWFAIATCAGLLFSLSCLQLGHLDFLVNQTDVLALERYRFWLFVTPPMFFYFSRATLLPEAKVSPLLLIHLLPVTLNFILPPGLAVPLIFLIGMGYSAWLSVLIYGMRAQRARFRIEMFFFGLFAITAVFVLVLGISVPYIDNAYFYYFYANSIGLAFVLIVSALMVFPDLLSEVAEVVKISYAASTLSDVDIEASLEKLERLMKESKLYQNDNLNLTLVAEQMDLSSHQLSELINVQFGINFSRYIREQRVAAAKKMLVDEPDVSVLAIGLETGFKSQSNFYAAFKEITGMSPGSYRNSSEK